MPGSNVQKSKTIAQKKKDIACHYNSIVGEARTESLIYGARKFHNWIKSCLINEALDILTFYGKKQIAINVLDLCCGKGGDLSKFRASKVQYVAAIDIAKDCIVEYRSRYKRALSNTYVPNVLFGFESHVADLGKESLENILERKEPIYNLASCQFSLHYMFNSFSSINNFVKNVSQFLVKGGIFIITIPNSNELIRRLRQSDTLHYGNEHYEIEFNEKIDKNSPKIFGEEYHFKFDKVVDLPEYLVHFDTLKTIFKEYGFDCIYRMNFSEYLEEKITSKNLHYNELFSRMGAFSIDLQQIESNPQFSEYVKSYKTYTNNLNLSQCKTISNQEWEVSTLYDAIMFMKK